jgi:hypothetical protein
VVAGIKPDKIADLDGQQTDAGQLAFRKTTDDFANLSILGVFT